jgi:hypothetical protein
MLDRMLEAIARWTTRRWIAALVGTVATALVIGLPTDVIPNPVFGREVAVTAWAYPVLVLTAVLSGLLFATYVREDGQRDGATDELDTPARRGTVAGALSYFAVGCPVCNKLVVVALGTVGAREWFEPIQPYLAVASLALLAVALRARLRNAVACPLPVRR